MAGIDRWLHYTVTTIDRFHCYSNNICQTLHSLYDYLKYLYASTHACPKLGLGSILIIVIIMIFFPATIILSVIFDIMIIVIS